MAVELTARIGSVELPNPVMTASGCAGHGDELGHYFPLSDLGAIVVKSLAAFEWKGNPAPRLHPVTGGMLNSVGLQGPGVAAWLRDDLPRLERAGARVVASIWGRSVDDYEQAAKALAGASPAVVAVEVNLSCPNLDGGAHLFAHSTDATSAAIDAALACERPLWAKLSPNTDQVIAVARAAREAGAEAASPAEGRAVHPVAVRAVHDVHAALPDLPIVGVGGIANGADAVEMMMAGAAAVQVGTATFADPRAPRSVLEGLRDWCDGRGVRAVADIVGAAHEDRRDA